jgi:membrane-associated protein
MVRIPFGKFFFFNLVGAATWIIVMVMAGHLLGTAFPTITDHLEVIVVGMVLLSAIPVIVSWLRNRNLTAKENLNEKL